MSFSEWYICRIDDVCRIRRGASPRPIQDYLSDSGMPWVKISDATASNSRFIKSTKEFIKEKGIIASRFIEKGTLILSNSATPGIPKIMGIDACVHDGWLIVDKFNNITQDFLYYVFIFECERLLNLSNGSVFRNLKTDIVKNYKVKIPQLIEQNRIVNILTTLDDKIEVNNQINKTLENMAQAIFKHWFIDFEFPNESGDPYKSSGGDMVASEHGMIPKGWEVSNLNKIAFYLNGLPMQKFRAKDDESDIPVMKIKELRQGNTDENSERCSSFIEKDYIINDGDIIFSWSGSLLVDIWCGGICGLNQHLFKVYSVNYDKWFYYLWTVYHLDKFIQIAQSKATTMGHIKREDLENAKVIIPNDYLYNLASDVLGPIFDSIIVNRIESREIKSLRDTLLPKLMSGEIRVPLNESGDEQ